MKVKIRAFTLIELILVLAIGSILLGISTNWYVTNIASANNKNNRQVDLQSSVSSSMDVIKNTLKKTSQIHLVGKNVYDPALSVEELNNTGLDVNYNYIALSKDKDTGNQTLVNIVYNKNLEGGKFEVFPLLAQERTDNLQSRNISYDMKFYKEDGNYRNKLDKNILNLTLIGNAHDVDENGQPVNSQNDILFQLSEDIYMQNINQILVSKHFEGGIDEVTAIAYDNQIVHGESLGNKVTKMSFVFAIDDSYSMRRQMNGKPLHKDLKEFEKLFSAEMAKDEFENLIKYDDPEAQKKISQKKSRRAIARDSIVQFLKKLDDDAKKSGIEVDAYIYTWSSNTLYDERKKDNDDEKLKMGGDPNEKYIYPLEKLSDYGPFKLGNTKNNAFEQKTNHKSLIQTHLYDTCKLGTTVNTSGTNTGLAILQGLEILNQLRDRNGNSQKQFFILLTDGDPTNFTTMTPSAYYKNDIVLYDSSLFLQYWGFISNAQDFYRLSSSPIYIEKFANGKYEFRYLSKIKNESYSEDIRELLPRLYIKYVTSFEKKNNRPNTFDKAYIIGFSDLDEDKKMLGINNKKATCSWQVLNGSDIDEEKTKTYFDKVPAEDKSLFNIPDRNERGSIKKFLSLEGTPYYKKDVVDVFDTDGSTSLDKAFADIVQSIGDVTGAFDGPKKLIGR